MTERQVDRRTVLGATAVALAGGLAGCTSGGSGGDSGGSGGSDGGSGGGDGGSGGDSNDDSGGGGTPPSFGGWLSEVGNYDGVVDETGSDSVTVEVGAQGNGGGFAFAPAAVRVDAETTVVWEWTGEGGGHNVNAMEGPYSFTSETTTESGFTFERTLEDTGTVKYQCDPHASLGMKGVVVVE